MATTNHFIKAEDGWKLIASDCDFIRIAAVPRSAGFYFYHGDSSPAVNAANASGTLTLSSTGPVEDDTVTVRGLVYTFKDAGAGGREVTIGATNDDTATNLAATITAQDTGFVAAVSAGPVVTISAVAAGTEGNSITLTENATNVAASGATLTGGTDTPIGNLVGCGEFWCDVPIDGNIYARVDTTLNDRPLRLDVFTLPSA